MQTHVSIAFPHITHFALLVLGLQYYSLDVTYFKSSLDSHLLDLLWNKYWVNTLSSSPLLGAREYVAGQISDLGESTKEASKCLLIFSHVSLADAVDLSVQT